MYVAPGLKPNLALGHGKTDRLLGDSLLANLAARHRIQEFRIRKVIGEQVDVRREGECVRVMPEPHLKKSLWGA
jgi:hypothetical protein